MAATLDISFIEHKLPTINSAIQFLADYGITVDTVFCIDNWLWENKQTVQTLADVGELLNAHRIVILKFKQTFAKDMGAWIRKKDSSYCSTFWINTEGYESLDSDKITPQNSAYYREIICAILKNIKQSGLSFKIAAIGMETNINDDSSINTVMEESQNVLIWILDERTALPHNMDDYYIKKTNGIKILIKHSCLGYHP